MDWINNGQYFPVRRSNVDGSPKETRYQTGDEIIETTLEIDKTYDAGIIKDYFVLDADGYAYTYNPIRVFYNGIEMTDYDAKEYYIKAYYFSTWVENNLTDIEAGTLNQFYETAAGTIPDEYVNFAGDESKIFDIGPNNNPESDDSDFVQHKRNLIRNSIQYNLNSAISTYNQNYYSSNYEYLLPVLSQADWENILDNISMVSFLEGIPCGTTIFNNYTIVKSNNNNNSVDVDLLYFTDHINKGTSAESSNNPPYHKYDCQELGNISATDWDGTTVYDSDLSAEFKYDAKRINTKIVSDGSSEDIVCAYDESTNTYYPVSLLNPYGGRSNINNIRVEYNDPIPVSEITNYEYDTTKPRENLTVLPNGKEVLYLYDHQNLGCYTCITGSNYTPVVKYINGELYKAYRTDNYELLILEGSDWFYYDTGEEYTGTLPADINDLVITDAELTKRRKSIYTAIAKYRNQLYKTNDYINR